MTVTALRDRAVIVVQRAIEDYPYYAEIGLKIRTKKGEIKPFVLNEAQRYLHEALEKQRRETGKVRALILKGRQMGCSTYTEGRLLWRATMQRGMRVFILTHEAAATKNLFGIAKTYVEHLPLFLKPEIGADSANELTFPGLQSSYRVGTAGNRAVGRSETIQLLHGSEAAFWPHADEHARGLMQAVPDEPGTEVIIESTANGPHGWFYQQCQAALRGEGEFRLIFLPWYWMSEYRRPVPADFRPTEKERALQKQYGLDDEQVMFRRAKIVELGASGADGEVAFAREYPCSVEEAFATSDTNTLIPALIIQRAMRSTLKEGMGRYIIGVDPARFGDDRSAIAVRRGRVVERLSVHPNIDLMTLTGVIVRLIKQYKPAIVNIDKGGLGAGVVDRLHELGFDMVNGVNFGGRAYQPDRYYNRRAEMWARLKLWLEDEPAKLPERDDLLSDLAAPLYSFDSNGRLKLESKDDMKKRGIRSPDLGDAVALTFAEDVSAITDAEEVAWQPADARIGI